MSDDGLTEATQRAQRLLGCRPSAGPRPGAGQVCALHRTHVRDGVCHMAQEVARAAREDVADLIQQARADAWDEGHQTRWRRDPDDGCQCNAWYSGECGCGLYGTGRLLSIDANPYRAAAIRDGEA